MSLVPRAARWSAIALQVATLTTQPAIASADGPDARPAPIAERLSSFAASASGSIALSSRGVRVFDPDGSPMRTLTLEGAAANGLAAATREGARRGVTDGMEDEAADPLDDLATSGAEATVNAAESLADAIEGGDASPDLVSPSIGARAEGPGDAGGSAGDEDGLPGNLARGAAGGVWAWVLADGGLWRIDLPAGDALRLAGARGATAVSASADGATIALRVGDRILRSLDQGSTFHVAGIATGRVRAMVAGTSGDVFVLDGAGLAWSPAGGGELRRVPLPAPALDVAVCGPELAVLLLGERWLAANVSAPASPRRTGPAPEGVARLACDPAGRTWTAWSPRLATSRDRGGTWTARSDGPLGTPIAVGATPTAIWVATAAGAWALSPEAAPPLPSTSGTAVLADQLGRWRWWQALLPKVSLTLDRHTTRAHVGTLALVQATFTFDAAALFQHRRALLRQAFVRAARTSATAAHALPGGADPTSAEERALLARVLAGGVP